MCGLVALIYSFKVYISKHHIFIDNNTAYGDG